MKHYNTVYVGMDVHKEKFSLCCYTFEDDKVLYAQNTAADYRQVLKYLDAKRRVYGEDAEFVCGYEAGCLGCALYRELTAHNVNCKILAPSTIPTVQGKKHIKTDRRDAENIAKALANRSCSLSIFLQRMMKKPKSSSGCVMITSRRSSASSSRF